MSHQKKRKNKKNKNRIAAASVSNKLIEDKIIEDKIIAEPKEKEADSKETDDSVSMKNEVEVKEKYSKAKLLSLFLVAIVIIFGTTTGFMVNKRPVMSEIEQRNLASFPTASVETIINGSFFADLSLWYADSYPLREGMIEANNSIKSLYGLELNVKMIGNDLAADEIPDLSVVSDNNANKKPMVSNSVNSASEDALTKSLLNNTMSENTASNNSISDNSVSMNFVYNPEIEIKIPETTAMEEEIKQYIQQNLYVKDGAAYSKYYFSKNSAAKYTSALESAAEQLEGRCNVINILVPNQSGAMLPYDEMIALGGSNQIDAIHYYYGQYKNVYTVDTIDTLRQHQDEYLYFRTDHHWTSLGAYYVYRNYCALKGWTPHELSYFTELTFDPYLGSFYSQLQDPDMRENPDYVKAYVPHGTNSLVYWDVAGVRHDWEVVTDVSKWNKYSGYSAFVGGDKPLAIIENPEIRDGSSCLVIKESYGNCFIPFLVDHYQNIYIMDCRYSTENYIKFVLDNNIQDLIFINNITIIGSTGLCNRIASNLTYEEL